MLGIRYNYSRINNNKTNVNYNVNNYYNNGGGASTMKKKYGNKFNNASARGVSQGTNFSVNGNTNHYYIGNPNSNFSHDPFTNVTCNSGLCLTNNKTTNVSVKNSKGLFQTRLKADNKITCNPVNSFHCYKKVNIKLEEEYQKDINNINDSTGCGSHINAGFNKHFRSENKDSSSKIERTKCLVDRSNYKEELDEFNKKNCQKNYNKKNYNYNKTCNVTKDLTAVNAYVVGYDVYMLKKKKCCSYNPPDAKVIAC